MSGKILTILLETGQYNLGRPGKSYYLRYSYTIEAGNIVISVDPNHPHKEYAINILANMLTKKYRLNNNSHFIQSNNDKITILKVGYTFLQLQKRNNSKLAYALETAQLLFSLLKQYSSKEAELSELERFLKSLLFSSNPLFKAEIKDTFIVYTINNKIVGPLAEQFRMALINAINHYIDIASRNFQNSQNDLRQIQGTKNIFMSKNLYDALLNYMNDLQRPVQSQPLAVIHNADLPQPNNIDYKVIHQQFDQINVLDDIDHLIETLNQYANLIDHQPTMKSKNAYKKVGYQYIIRIFKNMNSLGDAAILFDHLLTLQYKMDIHSNPLIDTLFSIYNTSAWQEMIGEIRDDAMLKLSSEVENLEISNTDQLLARLNYFLEKRLFYKHRSNWYTSTSTTAELDISDMITKVNESNAPIISSDRVFDIT